MRPREKPKTSSGRAWALIWRFHMVGARLDRERVPALLTVLKQKHAEMRVAHKISPESVRIIVARWARELRRRAHGHE